MGIIPQSTRVQTISYMIEYKKKLLISLVNLILQYRQLKFPKYMYYEHF